MTRADAAVALALLLGNGALYAAFWQAPVPATTVEVRAGDQPPQRYPLSSDQDIRVTGRDGDSLLRIRDGRVRFIDSPCRNRICVHAGWHHHGGDSAACVPNGVSIRLLGGDAVIDAVAH